MTSRPSTLNSFTIYKHSANHSTFVWDICWTIGNKCVTNLIKDIYLNAINDRFTLTWNWIIDKIYNYNRKSIYSTCWLRYKWNFFCSVLATFVSGNDLSYLVNVLFSLYMLFSCVGVRNKYYYNMLEFMNHYELSWNIHWNVCSIAINVHLLEIKWNTIRNKPIWNKWLSIISHFLWTNFNTISWHFTKIQMYM